MSNTCTACGACCACCACLRVDFSVRETEDLGGPVPGGLAVEVNHSTAPMRGTDHSPPRCATLSGKVGQKAVCGIDEWRPSPCREFAEGSEACTRLRQRRGLPALAGAD